jgi:hypothetical protein
VNLPPISLLSFLLAHESHPIPDPAIILDRGGTIGIRSFFPIRGAVSALPIRCVGAVKSGDRGEFLGGIFLKFLSDY